MKKFTMLLLCLLLMMSVCAAEAPATEEFVFDPAWAGEEFSMPVPKPPFEQLEVQHPDDEMYMITALDPAEVGAVTDAAVLEYIEQLKTLIKFDQINMEGFYLNRYDEPKYGFGGQTEEGIVVEFDLGRGGGKGEAEPGFIMVLIWPEEAEAEETTEPAADASLSAETKAEPKSEDTEVPVGTAKWTSETMTEPNGNVYTRHSAKDIAKEEVDAIVNYLMSRYKLYEDVDDGKWHHYGFENEETYGSLMLGYSEKYQKCNIDVFGDFAK